MWQRLSIRMAPLTNRAADYAPVAPACCNACRTCATTNVVGLVFGGVTVAALGIAHLAGRFARSSRRAV